MPCSETDPYSRSRWRSVVHVGYVSTTPSLNLSTTLPLPQVGVLARDLVRGRGFVHGGVEPPVTFDVLGVGGGGSEAQLLGQLANLLVAIKQVPS
jgi:hypothetical protein